MGTHQEISLYFQAGNSDKEYHAGVYTKDQGFVVDFRYGRRGSTLTMGTKTGGPVPLEKAVAIFDKLVKEKLGKGYSPGPNGVPYQHTDQDQRATGIIPQLLNPVEESALYVLLKDPEFWAQEKHDGRRMLICVSPAGTATGINRRGLTIALPAPIEDLLPTFGGGFTLDGECVGAVFHAFDILECKGDDLRTQPYSARLAVLQTLLASYTGAVRLVDTARTKHDKNHMLTTLREHKREGIVFKDHTAPYVPGRPNSGGPQLKYKFTATASCLVMKVNEGKRSVAIVCRRPAHSGGFDLVDVGNVTILPNFSIPKAGVIVEVRYLNYQAGGSLYQPVYLGERDDIDMCDLISTLKIKADVQEDENEES